LPNSVIMPWMALFAPTPERTSTTLSFIGVTVHVRAAAPRASY
jgi:hypothetical protein